MDVEQAKAAYVKILLENCYDSTLRIVASILQEGPRVKDERMTAAHAWYREQPAATRDIVDGIVAYAVELSAYGVALIADGRASLNEYNDAYVDVQTHLQVYSTPESKEHLVPSEYVEIGPNHGDGEEIHDLFVDELLRRRGEIEA
jgi:hypothetical protein